ncbi:MAG: ferrochelatase [Albidovulum sp.]|nr:ferrochelatase [Albidovulum sp.]MDE0307684.1 ferrochelatase [Albidovulum sp.]MDE0532141.1 ferrochelatase [Albidovulum sp.]
MPPDHPTIPNERVGILLANLGTPDGYGYWPMRRYLREFLSDRRVIDYPRWMWLPILYLFVLSKRPFTSGKAYKSIWNNEADESPLLTITKRQTAKLRMVLLDEFGCRLDVDFCMRYGSPKVSSVLQDFVDRGCRKILFFPLYPQYAGATTATANDEFFNALLKMKWQPAVRTVPAYFENDMFIDALAASVDRAFEHMDRRAEVLVASYHGLPVRYLVEGDPYHCQCQKTSRLLAEKLGWSHSRIVTTFQSRFGPEEWLKPYTVDEIRRLAREGVRRLAVVAPSFSADCIETLEEIQVEIKDAFLEAGGEEFTYIPCLNDEASHIEALAGIARRNLAGWIE